LASYQYGTYKYIMNYPIITMLWKTLWSRPARFGPDLQRLYIATILIKYNSS